MLEICQMRVYRGPSVWAREPVIRIVLDSGKLEGRSAGTVPGFADRLVEMMPSLEGHLCSLGGRGGFVQRMRMGMGLEHVLEHIARELQQLSGSVVISEQTCRHDEWAAQDGAVYAYRHEDVGIAAAEVAIRLLNHLIHGTEPGFDLVQIRRDELVRVAEAAQLGPSTRALVEEAERRGIPVARPDADRSFVLLGQGSRQRRIWATATDGTSLVAAYAARDKAVTARLLRGAFIPTPTGVVVTDAEAAAAAAESLGYPVAVKPLDGNHGRGVGLNLEDAVAVRDAFAIAASATDGSEVVVQRQAPGHDYRILVVGGEVIAVAERVPAHVVGDGVATVRELVDRANADPRRGEGHARILTRVPADDAATTLLMEQDLSWEDVPQAGRCVHLASTANLSTGGTSIDRTDDIHVINAQLAREAALVVGLDVAGIDVVTPDISRPLMEDGGVIVEVNAAPGFRMHTHPSEGKSRPVARRVLGLLFPSDASARAPVVAVTGTNGKTTTTRMVARMLRFAGGSVGMTTTDGVYLGDRLLAAGDMAGPASARAILRHPGVESAVLETARGGILREGLGFDRCTVAIVTNVAEDHLGLGGVETLDDLARVKAVVPASVFPEGSSILNADDPRVVEMARSTEGEVIFFSGDDGNPVLRDHRLAGGRAAVLVPTEAGDVLRLVHGSDEEDLLSAADIPATFGGILRVNALNALAAAAGAWSLDISIVTIRDALRSFHADFATTPGRFNLLEVEGRQVVIDYAHNVAAMEAVGDFVRQFGAPRSVAMLAIPGDRSDEDTRSLGTVAAGIFDGVVIREAANTRGRARGESAGLLWEAVLAAGMPESEIRIVLDEVEAAHATVDHAAPGDLAVIFVTRPGVIWEELSVRAAQHTTTKTGTASIAPAMPSVGVVSQPSTREMQG